MSSIIRAKRIIRNEGISKFLIKFISSVSKDPVNTIPGLGIFFVSFARKKLVKSLNNLVTIDKIINFTFNFKSFGISIYSAKVYEEIRELLRIVF